MRKHLVRLYGDFRHVGLACSLLALTSCSFFTGPDPSINTTSYSPRWGVTLKDHSTGQVLQPGQVLTAQGLIIDIVPDSSAMQVAIDSVKIDNIPLAHGTTEWYDTWVRVGCILDIQNNRITVITGGVIIPQHGQHPLTLAMTATNPNSGLYSLLSQQLEFNLTLDFH